MLVKICGLMHRDNITEITELGPDMIGFIFYDGSPRDVSNNDTLAAFARQLKNVQKVGVFVNASEKIIAQQVARFGLDYLQLHGSEPPSFCRMWQWRMPVIKAFAIHPAFDADLLNDYKDACSLFLFDSFSAAYGGSGRSFDWQLLSGIKTEQPFLLSGGIGTENIEQVKKLTHKGFAGIDINSRVETIPGYKNISKIKTILHEIRTR